MEYKIDGSGRGHKYTQEEIEVVADVMQNAATLTQGKYRDEFEKKFQEYIGTDNAFTTCNATASLEIAAQLCAFKKGDELIAPAHTFTASVYPFVKKGANVVWADIDLNTRVVNSELIEKKITNKTKAIIVVHLYGYMVEMTSIMELARKYNLLVIEDVAQALGTEMKGKKAGAFGDIGIYSLHSHKNLTTLGEGGIITVKNSKHAEIIPMLRHNGHCSFSFDREHYWMPAMGNVDMPELNGEMLWPNNYCLGEVECALGSKLMDRLDQMNNEKRERAIWFIDEFKNFSELEFHRVNDKRHNYHLLAARLTNGKRDQLFQKMAYEKKIKCDVRYYPLYRYPLYQKMGFGLADCPQTDLFYDSQICFPFEHWRSDDDIRYIVESTKEALTELRKG